MDDGYVLPGLNEEWTLAGAKLFEWIAGLCTALVFSEIFLSNIARSMPFVGLILLVTTFGLATLRRSFPDEEKGVRNFCLDALGICPPGIPAPASIQPIWSGAPLSNMAEQTNFIQLGLQELFVGSEEEIE